MKKIISLFFMLVLVVIISGCSDKTNEEKPTFNVPTDSVYKEDSSWVYKELDEDNKTDTFFICPTCTSGDEGMYNFSLTDETRRSYFAGATLMEKYIYDSSTRFFAPYYTQALLQVYNLEETQRNAYLTISYNSIKEAFAYYMNNYNNGNAIILAGFSQGADMCLRLLEEFFTNEYMANKLVACYAIGWQVSDEYLAKSKYLKFATAETDTGVIISFNTEDASITSSFAVGENEHSNCINPLNWKTDGTIAAKELNLGACFYSGRGVLKSETKALCGAYIETKRGVLKVTDINMSDYPNKLSFSKDGVYHTYDYQFFYKNLELNVMKRIISYWSNK